MSANEDAFAQGNEALNQQNEIRAEASSQHPIMGKSEPVGSSLKEQFKDNEKFLQKIDSIAAKYSMFRRSRPDGNCFYRTYLFGLFERLLRMSMEERNAFLQFFKSSLDDVMIQGYEKFAVEEMFEDLYEELEKIAQNENATIADIELIFDEERHYHICYLRCVVSAFLKKNAALYESFLVGFGSIAEFCAHEVDPMWREADQLQILALSTYLKIPCVVVYLDQSEGNEAAIHQVPEDLTASPIHLLYRPGHYDYLIKEEA